MKYTIKEKNYNENKMIKWKIQNEENHHQQR